jgi:flagellar protein FlaG
MMSVNPIGSGQVQHSLPRQNPAESINNQGGQEADNALMMAAQLARQPKCDLSIGEEALLKAVEKANKAIDGEPRYFEYVVHKPSNVIVVKMINSETKEVIREIPPEKILDLIDKLQELNGSIIDEKR